MVIFRNTFASLTNCSILRIPMLMLGWGAMTMILGAVNGFAPLVVVRFLLGAFEAGLFPGIIYCLTFWYKPEERALRAALILACATLGRYILLRPFRTTDSTSTRRRVRRCYCLRRRTYEPCRRTPSMAVALHHRRRTLLRMCHPRLAFLPRLPRDSKLALESRTWTCY